MVYGLIVGETNGEVCLKVNKNSGRNAQELLQTLFAWKAQTNKFSSGEMDRKTYNCRRYHYPQYGTAQIRAKVPSQQLSDDLIKSLSKHTENK